MLEALAVNMKYILTLILVLAPFDALSCRPEYYSDEERINMAKDIYVGYVIGVNLVGFEEQRKEEPLNPKEERIVIPQPEELVVLVKETYKGRSKSKIKVEWRSCGNGAAEVRDKVIVFRNSEYDFITIFNEELYAKVSANK